MSLKGFIVAKGETNPIGLIVYRFKDYPLKLSFITDVGMPRGQFSRNVYYIALFAPLV